MLFNVALYQRLKMRLLVSNAFKKVMFHLYYKPRNEIYKRYNGKDAFHKSLDFDVNYYEHLSESKRKEYVNDLLVRRNRVYQNEFKD